MKKLLLCLMAGLLIAAVPAKKTTYANNDWSTAWEIVVLHSEACYVTSQGIQVRAFGVCPAKDEIESETDNFMSRMSLKKGTLKGVKAYFTPYWLQAWFFKAYGIAPKENTIVVKLAGSWGSWMDTYCHEMGHQLLYKTASQVGLLHDSYPGGPCDDDPKLHSCELLPAATALGVKTPALTKKNKFRKMFSQL